MQKNKLLIVIFAFLLPCFWLSFAYADDNFGQTIEINTDFHSFIGKPSWLIMIRDVDHNQNYPYLFDIKRGDNYWVIPTHSRNYLITASTLKINTYQARTNAYKQYQIRNFCHLETNGKILRGQSIYLTITGNLSSNHNTVNCQVSKYGS